MAINSREARREAEKKRLRYVNDYITHLLYLFHNSIKIENLPKDLPKRYLLGTIARFGAIAYDYETGLFLRFVEIGYNVYGLPEQYQLYGANGYTVRRYPDQVCILRANDLRTPIKPYIENQANKLVDFDMAIEQNLEAIKTMTIAECETDDTLLSLVNLANSRRVGATIAYVNKNTMTGSSVKVQSTGAQYLVDKLIEARQKVLNETLERLGIGTANTDKKERVQGMEIDTSLSKALDEINVLVDTFNYDAEIGGLDIRLKINTALDYLLKERKEDSKDDL